MRNRTQNIRMLFFATLLLCLCGSLNAKKSDGRRIIFIMVDGMRWQELYTGADSLLGTDTRFTKKPASVKDFLSPADAESRRRVLMPFVWSHVAEEGLLVGNRTKGSLMRVANSRNISYPGYSETLCGHPDDERIKDNGAGPNPNTNLLEVANETGSYRGNVCAFARWGTQKNILNVARNGLPLVAGRDMFCFAKKPTEKEKTLDEMKRMLFDFQADAQLDLWVYQYATEHMRKRHPKFVFIQFGDTDLHGHNGRYDYYLSAIHGIDHYLQLLWEQVQDDPFYRDKTTFVVTCDHGRGLGEKWTDHGPGLESSEQTWLMAFGKDIAALGEMTADGPFYNKQVAASLARMMGIEYQPDGWEIGTPLPFLFSKGK